MYIPEYFKNKDLEEVAYAKKPNLYKKPYLTKLKEGFTNGWSLVQGITIGLVSIWPILLILGILFFMRKKIKFKISK